MHHHHLTSIAKSCVKSVSTQVQAFFIPVRFIDSPFISTKKHHRSFYLTVGAHVRRRRQPQAAVH